VIMEEVIKDPDCLRLIMGCGIHSILAAPLNGHPLELEWSFAFALLGRSKECFAPMAGINAFHGHALDLGNALNVSNKAIEPDQFINLINRELERGFVRDEVEAPLLVDCADLAMQSDEGERAGFDPLAKRPRAGAREGIALIP